MSECEASPLCAEVRRLRIPKPKRPQTLSCLLNHTIHSDSKNSPGRGVFKFLTVISSCTENRPNGYSMVCLFRMGRSGSFTWACDISRFCVSIAPAAPNLSTSIHRDHSLLLFSWRSVSCSACEEALAAGINYLALWMFSQIWMCTL